MTQGWLKFFESLDKLELLLGHLSQSKLVELCSLIRSYPPTLFSDVPTWTHLVEHDIDVGDAVPIRQRFYRTSPGKRKQLEVEVKYMLQNGIAEPSHSSWASPCLLVAKQSVSCTDFRSECHNQARQLSPSSYGGLRGSGWFCKVCK